MAAGNQVILTFAGDAKSLDAAAARAAKATEGVGDAAARAGQQSTQAGADTQDYTGRLAKLSIVTMGVGDAVTQAGGLITELSSIQSAAKERAAAHARALLDVEQAGVDADQALRDLKQAQLDLNQSMIDARQAGVDAEQAILDQKQAAIDARTAQVDYTAAVKEHGKGSIEARQAAQDLAQAQLDLRQAGVDSQQAQADLAQAQEDGRQAIVDAKQATLDQRSALQDMADAQREASSTASGWKANVETATSIASGLVGTVGLAALAMNALNFATIRATASAVAARTVQLASAAATGIATAAQWAWNVAMSANPIGLVILAIGALVAAVVWIATKTDWFQRAWRVAWGGIKTAFNATKDAIGAGVNWVTSKFNALVGFLGKLRGKVSGAFGGMFDGIKNAFKAAVNWVIDKWNNFRIPGIPVPGIGTIGGLDTPNLPRFHSGGIVPGAPGSETLAILQAGERVIPASQASQGGSVQLVVSGGGSSVDRLLAAWLHEAVRTGQVRLSVRHGRLAVA